MTSVTMQTQPARAFKKGDHTVILGWSGLAIEVIREIAVANQNKRGSKIVILSGQPREVIARQLFDLQGKLGKTKVYIQAGEPTDESAKALINISAAKSIIDFASGDVVQISSPTGGVVLVQENKLTAGVQAQIAKHPSMAAVIGDLLNFEGEEIYFNSLPALTGKTYADVVLAFNTASVIGLVDDDGATHLNPSQTTVIGPETLVIAVAEDDDKVVYTGVREDIANRVYVVGSNPAALIGKGVNAGAFSVDNVIAKFVAQVSENLDLAPILYELLSDEGASVNINSIESYVSLDEDVEFAELVAIASAHGQSAIGFLAGAASGQPHGGVWLNPPKNTVFRPIAGDGLVIVSSLPR